MSNVNITRHDRGLDSKRIEKIIDMINGRIHDIKYDRQDVLKELKAKLKEEVIELHNLAPHYAAIKGIDNQIKKLEDQISRLKEEKNPHKIAIALVMRGSDNTYDHERIVEGSPADQYMKERIPDVEGIKEQLNELSKQIGEQLWLAKDIDEARGLYNYALQQIDSITKGL